MSEKDPSIPTNLLAQGVIAAQKRAEFFAKSAATSVEVAVVQPVAATSSVEAAPVTPVVAATEEEDSKGATADIDDQVASGVVKSGRRRTVEKGSKKLSQEEETQLSQAVADLESQKHEWIQRIRKADTQARFNTITQDAGRNGSWRTVPGFVIGASFTNLINRYAIDSDKVKKPLEKKALASQKEIEEVYTSKRGELFPPKDNSKDVPPVVPAAATPEPLPKKISRTREKKDFAQEVAELTRQKAEWKVRIEMVTTRDELSIIAKKARENGSSGEIPLFFLGKFLDGLLKKYDTYSDDMKNELKAAAEKSQEEVAGVYLMKRAELEVTKTPTPGVPEPVASVISPVEPMTTPGARKEIPAGEKHWTVKKLLPYIEDKEEFSVFDAKGKAVKYQRDGDRFLTTDKKPKNADKAVLRVLNHGGTVKRAGDTAPVAATPDASAAVEKKDGKFFLEKENEPVLFVGNNNFTTHRWNRVVRKGDKYFFLSHGSGELSGSNTEEQIRELATREEWQVVTDDTEYKKAFGLLPKDPVVEGAAAALSSEEEERALSEIVEVLERRRDRGVAEIQALTSPVEHKYFFWGDTLLSDEFLNDLLKNHAVTSAEVEKKVREKANLLNKEIETAHVAKGEQLEKEAALKASMGTEEYRFNLIPEGRQIAYQGLKGELTVERRGDMYQIVDRTDGESGFIYDEEHIRSLAQAEKWELLLASPDLGSTPIFPAGTEPRPTFPDGMSRREFIDQLEAKVEEMRLQFVTIDYKEASLWKKLKGIFGKHVDEQNTLDRETCRQSYEHALTELQEAKLEEFKAQGLAGKELKEAMAGLLRYFRYDERVKLYDTRTQVRLEDPSKNYGVKAVEFFETLGREYNKLSKWKKVAIAAGCFAGAGALTLGGGVVGATAAGGVLLTRRLITGLGAGVALDSLIEGASEGLKKWNTGGTVKKMNKWIDENEGELLKEDWQDFDKYLKQEIEALDKKFKRQQMEALLRKTVALGVGVGIGSGYFGSILAEKAGLSGGGQSGSGVGEGKGTGTPRVEVPRPGASAATGAASGAQPSASAVAAPASGVGAPQGADQSQIKAVPAEGAGVKPEAAPEEAGKPKAQPAVKPEVVDPKKPEQELLKDHKVTLADSKKGLWGVLEKRFLPADISKPAGNRVVQSLENLIQQKLDAMTPEARAEAGFPTGRIDMIQRGGVIRFDDLLSAQEIQEVLEGKDIEAPQTITMEPAAVEGEAEPSLENTPATPDITDMRTEAPGDIPGDTLKDTSEGMKGLPSRELEDSSVDIPAEPKTVAEFDVQRNLSNPKEFLMEHPELKGKLFETVGKVRQGIFVLSPRLDGVLPEQDYLSNREKLGGMKVSQVLKDLGNPSGVNHELNPLHNDQMKALGKFVNAAEKSFGPVISQPGAGENIDSYTSRMATMAVRTGKAIRGFYKP